MDNPNDPQEESLPDSVAGYTPEELQLAQQELNALTPEGYIELTRYMHSLEDQTHLPEAGGFAWVTLVSKGGAQVNFGERAVDSYTALKRLRGAIQYAIASMGLQPPGLQPPKTAIPTAAVPSAPAIPTAPPAPLPPMQPTLPTAPPAPTAPVQPSQATQPTIQTIDVVSVAHTVGMSNNDILTVRGGRWTKFGVPAYNDAGVIPPPWGDAFKTWPINTTYPPPPEMAVAWVETYQDSSGKEHLRVRQFAPKAPI